MVLDGKRTESRNLAFWTEKRNPQFWTEFGRKTGKSSIDGGKNRQILSHSLLYRNVFAVRLIKRICLELFAMKMEYFSFTKRATQITHSFGAYQ